MGPSHTKEETRERSLDPATIVYNHLNQPRELVKGNVMSKIMA